MKPVAVNINYDSQAIEATFGEFRFYNFIGITSKADSVVAVFTSFALGSNFNGDEQFKRKDVEKVDAGLEVNPEIKGRLENADISIEQMFTGLSRYNIVEPFEYQILLWDIDSLSVVWAYNRQISDRDFLKKALRLAIATNTIVRPNESHGSGTKEVGDPEIRYHFLTLSIYNKSVPSFVRSVKELARFLFEDPDSDISWIVRVPNGTSLKDTNKLIKSAGFGRSYGGAAPKVYKNPMKKFTWPSASRIPEDLTSVVKPNDTKWYDIALWGKWDYIFSHRPGDHEPYTGDLGIYMRRIREQKARDPLIFKTDSALLKSMEKFRVAWIKGRKMDGAGARLCRLAVNKKRV